MRWLCKECHHPTTSSWCDRCKRNTGVFTAADLGAPRGPAPRESMSASETDSIVKRIVKTFGGIDPKDLGDGQLGDRDLGDGKLGD